MLLRFSLGLAMIGLILHAHSADIPVHLGNEVVNIHVIENGMGKVFLHVHQNETTALHAAKEVVKQEHGKIITLQHSGQRNIQFKLNDRKYEFDPNRMFTDQGIKKTLYQFGSYSEEAHCEVKKLAEQIKNLLPHGKVIAVHNNRSYSIKDYLPGRHLSKDAEQFNFIDKPHYRNFFLVTKKQDYIRLKSLSFNSILQSPYAEDDGSLSIYLASKNYVNVEAGYNELNAQIQMLKQA